MNGYRVEWRDPLDAGDAPDVHMSRDVEDRRAAVELVAALVAADRIADSEVAVVQLDHAGSALVRIFSTTAHIAAWAEVAVLPKAKDTRWGSHLIDEVAATDAVESIRRRLRTSVRAGTVIAEDALALIMEAERLLDPEPDLT